MINKANITFNKVASLLLLLSMILTISSCRENNNKNMSSKGNNCISANSPWYDGFVINVDMGVDTTRQLEYLRSSLAGADDKQIVIYADGYYKPDGRAITSGADVAVKNIIVIDRTTNQVSKIIDLYNILNGHDWPENAIYDNGQLIIKGNSWKEETGESFKTDFYIDLESEKLIMSYDSERNNDLYYTGSYNIGDYRIETISNQRGEFKSYILRVYSPDGAINDVNISASGKNMFGIPIILSYDETTALVPVEMERDYKFFKLDLIKYRVSEVNAKDFEWLNIQQLLSSYNCSDGKVYFTTPQGISSINMINKTVENVFDYSWCGVNRQYLKDIEIADYSEDKILLCGQYNSSNIFTSIFVNNFVVIELRKVDKNPHADKKIIELYTPDGDVDEAISDAIIKYNENNDKYFIKLSDRFNRYNYLDFSDINSSDDYESALLNADRNLSDDLAMALMSGDGPDILLNTSSLGQLNNDNYLIDLSPYFVELDSNKHFTDIIEGSKTDGKLYQLPISFTIEGIQTDPEYSGITGIGFTTEEYNKFLYETLNGKDVIESGQSLYFVKLFNGMSDRFIVNGKVDLTSSEFEDIAGYVRDNVQQDSLSWDIISDENIQLMDFTTKGNKTAYYCNCPGISGYLVKRAQIKNGTAILGIPSSDGRGPMFGTDISVAISTHAVNIDACVEFVKILLSDDVQNELVMSDKFVLNRDAFKKGCNAAIEYFNTEEGSQNLFDYAAGTYVTSHMKFTSEDIDNLESVIMSCSKMDSADSAINAILIEEMPAYFLGQKDLTSVVTIIQDRVQKVLDERG